jgi:hypothetical protein
LIILDPITAEQPLNAFGAGREVCGFEFFVREMNPIVRSVVLGSAHWHLIHERVSDCILNST